MTKMPELIDRIELRKDFCNMCEAMQPEMIDCNKKCCMSMQIIDEQPTIEPEVRRGRWKTKVIHDTFCFQCSACNSTYNGDTNYCPHCGARMDGGADNADQ